MRNRDARRTHIGIVRDLPRHRATGQRAALAEAEVSRVLDLAERPSVETLDMIPTGAAVYVTHAHLLAERRADRSHEPRRELLWWLLHLWERDALLVELARNRQADSVSALLLIAADAIEVISKGARGRARRTARENGKAGGRPRKVITPEQTAAALAIWRDPTIVGVEVTRERLRKARTGYSLKRAYDQFGPRGGRG